MISGPIERISESERKKFRIQKLRINKERVRKMRINKISLMELGEIQRNIVKSSLDKKAKTILWRQDKPHCKDLGFMLISFTIISTTKILKTIKAMDTPK